MASRPRLALLLVPLALPAACGRGRGPSAHLPAAVAQALGPRGSVNAAGEPLWSAEVRPGLIRVSLGGTRTLTTGMDGYAASGSAAVWRGRTTTGVTLRVVVDARPCHDRETGMPYPLSARVEVAGRPLFGCAAAPGKGLGPRR